MVRWSTARVTATIRISAWWAGSRRSTGDEGRSPVVQFYGGGAIPLSLVRYHPDIENFHPAPFQPGSTGRSYRKMKA